MQYSAGIIPFRINEENKMEFFVGHPGGKKWEKQDYWALLKGGVENDEDWLTTAIREFKEESSFSLDEYNKKSFIPLGSVIQNPRKIVVAYGIYCPHIIESECYSNIADNGLNPEIDRYRWMTYDVLKEKTHKKHLIFYEKLIELENEYKNNK